MKRIIRMPAVIEKTGLAESTIYEHVAKGRFPRQVKIGSKSVGWLEHEVDSWIDDCAAARDGIKEPEAA
jgi:prophage regulatory protein